MINEAAPESDIDFLVEFFINAGLF